MQWKNVWLIGALAVALAGADGKVDPGRIDKLIEDLGSDAFKDREDATKALEAAGEPALEKLRKAAKSDDAEVRKRATGLVAKIEYRTATARVLRPREVHLVYKDTPLKDALDDFAKQSGYPLALIDPDGRLAGKKVTLDTGKTTFWDAMERFTAAAGLVEAAPGAAAAPAAMPGAPAGFGGAAPPALLERLKKAIKERDEALDKRLKELDKRGAAPAPIAPRAAALAAVLAEVKVGGAGGVADVAPAAVTPSRTGQITLIPGTAERRPADTRTSVRVRVAGGAAFAPGGKTFALTLQASPEPRLRWQQLVSVTVEKATDDNDQTLTARPAALPAFGGGVMRGGPGMPGVGGGMPVFTLDGMNPSFTVTLEKGAKESKKLKVLEGSLTARFLGEAQACVVVKDVMKSAGTTVRGEKGGAIAVETVSTAPDGTVQIGLAFDPPADVVPEAAVDVLPAPALGGMPLLRGIGAPARVGGPVVIGGGVVIGGAPGGMIGGPPGMGAGGTAGLSLQDDKGRTLPASFSVRYRRAAAGGPVTAA
ncbi:MAG: hypothetical protein ACRC33_00550, partial [Gemmataceae bacterium]